MLLAPLDEKEAPRGKLVASAFHDRFAVSRDDEEPLVGTAMAIVAAAFRLAGGEHHLGGLRSAIAFHHPESFAEAKLLLFHYPIVQRAAPRRRRPAFPATSLECYLPLPEPEPLPLLEPPPLPEPAPVLPLPDPEPMLPELEPLGVPPPRPPVAPLPDVPPLLAPLPLVMRSSCKHLSRCAPVMPRHRLLALPVVLPALPVALGVELVPDAPEELLPGVAALAPLLPLIPPGEEPEV